MKVEIVKKHVQILQKEARRNRGVLPSTTTLENRGLFYPYDILRAVGLLYRFKRAFRRKKA